METYEICVAPAAFLNIRQPVQFRHRSSLESFRYLVQVSRYNGTIVQSDSRYLEYTSTFRCLALPSAHPQQSMASFRHPTQLLHDIIEPQWLPKQKAEIESSLDTVERAEMEHWEFLRSTVLPTVPEPLGLSGSDQAMGAQQRVMLLQQAPLVDFRELPPVPSFWERYRTQHCQQQQQQQQQTDKSQSANDMPPTHAVISQSAPAFFQSPTQSTHEAELDCSTDMDWSGDGSLYHNVAVTARRTTTSTSSPSPFRFTSP